MTVPVPGNGVISWAATQARCRGTAGAGAVTGCALHGVRRTCAKGVVAGPEDEPNEVRSITPARGDRGGDGAVAAVMQFYSIEQLGHFVIQEIEVLDRLTAPLGAVGSCHGRDCTRICIDGETIERPHLFLSCPLW